jgi:hypothetical protein
MGFIKRVMLAPALMAKKWDAYKLTARNPQHNDIYIVEFPKSGITWLTCLLANMSLHASSRKEVATFSSARLYIPDIHITRFIAQPVYSAPPVRFIKSHSRYNPNYPAIIYLCRKPVSVMRSYYIFSISRGEDVGSFHDFCFESKLGLNSWKRHVESWLDGPVTGRPLHLIRYEDMVDNSINVLQDLIRNFGWNIDEELVVRAVDNSNIQKMSEQEDFYAKYNPRHKLRFVKANLHIEGFDEVAREIEMSTREHQALLGYV